MFWTKIQPIKIISPILLVPSIYIFKMTKLQANKFKRNLHVPSPKFGVYNPKNNVIVRGGGMLLFYGLQKCQVYGLLNEPNGIHHQPPIAGQRKGKALYCEFIYG